MVGKAEAQKRADRVRAFREELAELEREGALTLDEAQRAGLESHLLRLSAELAERFDIDTTEGQKQISWGMRIASTLGGAALCAAVVMFFHRYWGALGVPIQVGLLIATPLLMLAATEMAARRERTLYYASLFSLVAFGAFVVNLNVLGSVFNLTPGRAALLAWGLFGLAVAYTYRLRLVLSAGVLCLMAYVATCLAAWSGDYWLSFIERPENLLPGSLFAVAVPALGLHRSRREFDAVYRLLGLVTLFLALLILSEMGEQSYLPWPGARTEVLYQLTGFAAGGLALWLGVRRGWAVVAYLAAGFLLILMYLRCYHWWWDWMPGWLFFLLLGLISIALLAVFRILRARVTEAVAP